MGVQASERKMGLELFTRKLGENHAFLPAIRRFCARLDIEHSATEIESTVFGGLTVSFMGLDRREGKALEAARMCAETIAGGRIAFFRARASAMREKVFTWNDEWAWRSYVRFEVRPTAGKWHDVMGRDEDRGHEYGCDCEDCNDARNQARRLPFGECAVCHTDSRKVVTCGLDGCPNVAAGTAVAAGHLRGRQAPPRGPARDWREANAFRDDLGDFDTSRARVLSYEHPKGCLCVRCHPEAIPGEIEAPRLNASDIIRDALDRTPGELATLAMRESMEQLNELIRTRYDVAEITGEMLGAPWQPDHAFGVSVRDCHCTKCEANRRR